MNVALSAQLRRWFGPLALFATVVGLHWVLTVPSAPMIKRGDKSRGPAAAGKAGKAAKGAGREAKSFMSEHLDEGFEARHLPALEHAYALALAYVIGRDGPLQSSAAPLAHEAHCRRWRCQIELCGDRRQTRAVHRVLKKMELEDDSLWDAFELGKVVKRGPKKIDPICLRATIRFSRPAPELKGIRISEATKLEKPKKKKKKKPNAKAKKPKAPAPSKPATSTSG